MRFHGFIWGSDKPPLIAALFEGIKPAVTAIVIVAVIHIAKRSIRHAILAWLAFLSFVAIFIFNVPFPLIIVSAGLFGFWLGQRRPSLFAHQAHTPSHRGAYLSQHSSMITPLRQSMLAIMQAVLIGI